MSTTKEENLKLALALRAARNILNLSLKQVGEQLGVTSAGVGKWESGLSPIKASVFNQLEKFYRYHGVLISIDLTGEPIVKISHKALSLLMKDPKSPHITPLSEIYENDREISADGALMQLLKHKYQLKLMSDAYSHLSTEELSQLAAESKYEADKQKEDILRMMKDLIDKESK